MIKKLITAYRIRKKQKEYAKYGVGEPTTINGNQYRMFTDIAKMPQMRKIAYQAALRDYQNGIEVHDLAAFTNLMIKNFDERNFSKAGHMMHTLKSYANLAYNDELLLNVANTAILLNDEDVTKPEQTANELKLKFCKDDIDVRVFFLAIALQLAGNSVDFMIVTEVLEYSKKRGVRQTKDLLKQEITTTKQ